MTPAVEGVPNASERATKLAVAHKWARWLHNPCPRGGGVPNASKHETISLLAPKWAWWLYNPFQLGVPQRFGAGGQNQKWPTGGRGGYINHAVWRVPNTLERGTKQEMAYNRAQCRLGGPQRFKGEVKIRRGPQVRLVVT